MRSQTTPRAVAAEITSDPRWSVVVGRERSHDGQFYYSVSSTGIYCRPSCGARQPKPQNVAFHATAQAARAAGFRPCLRCKPDQPSLKASQAVKVAAACRAIESADTPPTLAQLARQADLSPYYFHRVFKALAGVTPKDYADAHRAQKLRGSLAEGRAVTEAIFAAGFNSSSRFYEQADDILGMTATRFRARGARENIIFAVGQSSLGAILVAASHKGLCAITLGEDPDLLVRDLQDRFANAVLVGNDPAFEALVASVVGLVEAPELVVDLPLDVRGTAFQRRVWKALSKVRAGSTISYAQIACQIGAPGAVRAVAQACAANQLAIAIPCHRVIRSDGELSGYRWGIERKRTLLAREGVVRK